MRRIAPLLGGTLLLALSALAWVDREEALVAPRRNFWSFQKPVRAEVPNLNDPWVRNAIDAFLLRAMQAKGLAPSAALPKAKLIRRVTLDLTGLPPSPEQVQAFVNDARPDAYERLVDRLMAAPQYGERWAQRWLDIVRYADTNGYELDAERPHAWRYRDYVVKAFNTDKPYDRFVQEQLAGDELWPGQEEALVATGFHRAGPIHLVGGNQDEEMNRQEFLTEVAGSVGASFLGLTVGCARCHNHKFDPILQSDYYRLQAVFAATESRDIELATAEEKKAFEEAKKSYEAKLKPVRDAIEAMEKPYRERIKAERTARLEQKYKDALAVAEEQRNDEQKRLVKEAKKQITPTWDEVLALVPAPEKAKRAELRQQLHAIEREEPEPLKTAYAVENRKEVPPTYMLKVGDHRQTLGQVEPGLLKVLSPREGMPVDGAGRRTVLAQWLTSPDHPLTGRVMANRVWQMRMGAGLVRTPNDFGALGQRPTNPQLLDWLATEFVAQGWSVKKLDKLIVMSSAYQQAAGDDAEKAKIDPENKLWWRANRRRMEAEQLRDSVLAVTGSLNLKPGGRPVRVPIEQEVYDQIFTEGEPDNLWPLSTDTQEQYRRSLYLMNKRNVRLPMLFNFDQPDMMTSCPLRPVSTHSLQALSLMNSEFMQQQARALASGLEQPCRADRNCQVREAYARVLSRQPGAAERQMADAFFVRKGLLADFCLAMMNRNEFVYLP